MILQVDFSLCSRLDDFDYEINENRIFSMFIKNLEIRRRLIHSMRNRISYSVAVAVSPETFQNEAF